jgi:hypothetical protein
MRVRNSGASATSSRRRRRWTTPRPERRAWRRLTGRLAPARPTVRRGATSSRATSNSSPTRGSRGSTSCRCGRSRAAPGWRRSSGRLMCGLVRPARYDASVSTSYGVDGRPWDDEHRDLLTRLVGWSARLRRCHADPEGTLSGRLWHEPRSATTASTTARCGSPTSQSRTGHQGRQGDADRALDPCRWWYLEAIDRHIGAMKYAAFNVAEGLRLGLLVHTRPQHRHANLFWADAKDIDVCNVLGIAEHASSKGRPRGHDGELRRDKSCHTLRSRRWHGLTPTLRSGRCGDYRGRHEAADGSAVPTALARSPRRPPRLGSPTGCHAASGTPPFGIGTSGFLEDAPDRLDALSVKHSLEGCCSAGPARPSS